MKSEFGDVSRQTEDVTERWRRFKFLICQSQTDPYYDIQNFDNLIWGCFGFDRMFGLNRLRVRELFPVINEQNKLNATDNVVVADFSRAAARRAA